jgi:hypothetical protein
MANVETSVLLKLYLNQTIDKFQLGCQCSGGSGICDGVEGVVVVVVVGSSSVSGDSDSNIHTQLLLKFTTIGCTLRCKLYCTEISFTISFPTQGI